MINEQQNKWPHALLINDIHVSKDNIEEFNVNWDEAIRICKDYGIQEIVIGGDLWQSRSSQTLPVLMAVRQAILKATKNDIELVIAEGNHCKIDQESNLGYSHIFASYPYVTVVDDFLIEDICDGITLCVMSYFPEDGSFINKLEEIKSREDITSMILYIHEGINGVLSQSSEKELPATIFKGFKSVLVGHYHDRCKIGDNIEYIGASRQHNYGEDEDKGYTILYSDGSTQFIQNKVNLKYVTLTLNPETISQNHNEIKKAVEEGKRVKVKIECFSDEVPVIDKQALLELGVAKIEIKSETITVEAAAQAISTKYDKSEIKKEYTMFCTQKEIEDIQTGLNYLDKIN